MCEIPEENLQPLLVDGCSHLPLNAGDCVFYMRVDEIIIGQRYNDIVITGPMFKKGATKYFPCKCANCGKEFEIAAQFVGKNKCCKECSYKGRIRDLTGNRYGRLVVLSFAGRRGGKTMWKCECDCGTIKDVSSSSLLSGYTRSCGCLHRDVYSTWTPPNKTHGMKDSAEFNIWSMMKNRCTNPNCNRHQFYKDKGIKVCDRWLGPYGFIHFIEDMGMRPGPRYSIDRIDNDGDYCPENCRWATKKEQSNNQSRNLILEYNGKKNTLALWCDELGLNYKRTWKRLKDGWSVKRAFEEPLDPRFA